MEKENVSDILDTSPVYVIATDEFAQAIDAQDSSSFVVPKWVFDVLTTDEVNLVAQFVLTELYNKTIKETGEKPKYDAVNEYMELDSVWEYAIPQFKELLELVKE